MLDNILIISSRLDYHARAVAWAIGQVGGEVTYLDTSSFVGNDMNVDFLIDHDKSFINVSGKSSYKAVYNRRSYSVRAAPGTHIDVKKFIELEQNIFSRWMLAAIELASGSRWINPIDASRLAENKAIQLSWAKEAGLSVPRTIISASPDAIRLFAKSINNQIIYKPLVGHFWIRGGMPKRQTQTAVIQDISTLSDGSLSACAGIYQECLKKIADVRVVVVGEKIFAARFDANAMSSDEVDFRRYLNSNRLSSKVKYEMPPEVSSKLLTLMRRLGIAYASADFAIIEDGSLCFLELNPAGQWGFVESMVPELRILDTIVTWLCGEKVKDIKRDLSLERYEGSDDFKRWEVDVEGNDNVALRPDFVITEMM
jgi:glutathione synthase/RimK-type ligase-like ATP-grasp enzyme